MAPSPYFASKSQRHDEPLLAGDIYPQLMALPQPCYGTSLQSFSESELECLIFSVTLRYE